MTDINELTNKCLYFTANRLTRLITKMAEEAFMITGLSPTYAFIVNIVNEKDGLSQKEIGSLLHLKPSTITRFLDKLEHKKLIKRKSSGKLSLVYSTKKGKSLQKDIDTAWKHLHDTYSEIIGSEEGEDLTAYLLKVSDMLDGEEK
ncbi:MarR family transcriptional regulator [Acidaminobacter sp. JC074]|uniref:MarR family winged helix-turn-helix transcriptional regulator n=1 Tax=Acidaminobacter sp. JC074 TaxID=2530199 RepID=UPI001F0E2D22|nr:MarR family transcriptional regulator [Acidaminobacter sp. JC074]MCH4889238.1 MarR family transcriptional regulator [Acidaminobacter sp. JC074]